MGSKLLKYILKRFILMIVTIWLIITITFFVMQATPGGPFNSEKAISEEQMAAMEAKFGLDKPLMQQYGIYLLNVVQLEFGSSIKMRGRTVIEIIGDGFKTSGKIGLIAAVLAIVSGVFFGALAAVNRGRWGDKIIQVLSTAFVATPSFIISTILLLIFCVQWQVFPANGQTAAGLILPIFTLSLYPMAYITRLERSSLLDVLGQDYIRTARAKGVSKKKVLFKHALKNALIPVITYAGPMVAYIVTGSLVVEKIFGVAGLGDKLINGITARDYPVIMGLTIFLAVLIVVATFICDMLYKVVDPRIEFK
ncbi:MAG: ABC transporter permease [Clostridia bacterium]|nr:ABC transporter permease [Clostridia bacterium]